MAFSSIIPLDNVFVTHSTVQKSEKNAKCIELTGFANDFLITDEQSSKYLAVERLLMNPDSTVSTFILDLWIM